MRLWPEYESFIQAMMHVTHAQRDVRQVPWQQTQELCCCLEMTYFVTKEVLAVHRCT